MERETNKSSCLCPLHVPFRFPQWWTTLVCGAGWRPAIRPGWCSSWSCGVWTCWWRRWSDCPVAAVLASPTLCCSWPASPASEPSWTRPKDCTSSWTTRATSGPWPRVGTSSHLLLFTRNTSVQTINSLSVCLFRWNTADSFLCSYWLLGSHMTCVSVCPLSSGHVERHGKDAGVWAAGGAGSVWPSGTPPGPGRPRPLQGELHLTETSFRAVYSLRSSHQWDWSVPITVSVSTRDGPDNMKH